MKRQCLLVVMFPFISEWSSNVNIVEVFAAEEQSWQPVIGDQIPSHIKTRDGVSGGQILAILEPEEEALFDALEILGDLYDSESGIENLELLFSRVVNAALDIKPKHGSN